MPDHPYVSLQDVLVPVFFHLNLTPIPKALDDMTEDEFEDAASSDMSGELHAKMVALAEGYKDPRSGKAAPLDTFLTGAGLVTSKLCSPDAFPGNATEWIDLCIAAAACFEVPEYKP